MPCALLAFFLAVPASAAAPLPESIRVEVAKIRWTPALTRQLVLAMPKVETHLHLDGALSPRLIKELAVAQNYAPLAGKSVAQIKTLAVVDKPRANLAEVLAAFDTVYPLLKTPESVERLAYEVAASAHAQNIRHLEVRFAPALQATETFSSEEVLKAALRGLERGRKEFGVGSGVLICLIRPFAFVSEGKNREMLELAVRYAGKGVVGIDLAGNEAAAPLSDFTEFYRLAKQAGLKLTAHAGEVSGSKDLETALELGVDRLGHATMLAQDEALMARVSARKIPIEVNLTSNLRTAAIKSYTEHPIRTFQKAGLLVTPSTDDPGVFGIDLNFEYLALSRRLKFTPAQLLEISYQGIDALFLPDEEKQALRGRFERELGALLARLAR